ncbi:pyrin-like [Parambassis ranga]|uniref:Pyrin-like n=1 Tax=Parambassis ranga TaxID=210632 RepID=A0A6P7J3P5_9TELE|nr:pyrin-like [Parambassis ranga]
MNVPELLLGALEDLVDEDFKKFKWFLTLNILDSCAPIPKCRLEKASQFETVSKMIENYGEELAVDVTVQILTKMRMNSAAEELKKAHTARKTSAPSTSSPAVTPAIAMLEMLGRIGTLDSSNKISGSQNTIKGSGNKVTGSGNIVIN